MQGNKFIKITFILLTGLFCFLTVNLFLLRFEAGDIYPPYSSFRADPMGTKALYDSIIHMGGLEVERNFLPSRQLMNAEDTCIIVPGVVSGTNLFITKKEYENLMRLADSGFRLVIGLTPRLSKSTSTKKTENQTSKTKKEEDSDSDSNSGRVDLFRQLGIKVVKTDIKLKDQHAIPSQWIKDNYQASPAPWQQAVWFKTSEFNTSGPEWKTIYSMGLREPVIIEKKTKTGSIVLLADSYIFSNESLKKDNNSPLLSWILGDKSKIMFDEYHLGVRKQSGISSLIKKYGLYGPAGLFILFAALVIWRQSSPLILPDESEELNEINHLGAHTKDDLSGFTSLLKQHIPRKELIGQCISAWEKSFVLDNQASQKYARLHEKIKPAINSPAANKSTIKTVSTSSVIGEYIHICHILAEKEKQ